MTLLRRREPRFPSFPSLFDDFMTRDISDWFSTNFSNTGTTLPAVNLRENDDEYVVELAAPGMTKKDFNIELENDVLTISSERKDEAEDKDKEGNVYRKEFSYQSFQRSFRFPQDLVNAEKINANYKDGILRLTLPKIEEKKVKPRKQIAIN
ncbi:MAG: Hsp20/alpha crystallin family protein [Cyclobacteriaceae bacterium]|nr:Hsp20/alpha crystallin family protein [Cyclobacteriaceae bacterium]